MPFRHRTFGRLDSTAVSTQQTLWANCSQSSWTTTGTQLLYAVGDRTTMDDFVVPQFFKRQKAGEVFFNDMSIVRLTGVRSTGAGPTRYTANTLNCSGTLHNQSSRDLGNQVESFYAVATTGSLCNGAIPTRPSLIDSGEVAKAILEVSTRVQSERGRSKTNLWETLAELEKSFSILESAFRGARDVILNAKRGKPVGVQLNAANLWLLYRYGIRPLISDVAGVIDGMKEIIGKRRFTSRSKTKIARYRSRVVTYTNSAFIVNIREDVTDDYYIRGMSLDESHVSTAFNIGFSSKGLITLPWELVKYSFVVDWFANVGDFLGALVPSPSFVKLGETLTIDHFQSLTISAVSTTANGSYTLETPCVGSYSCTSRNKTRSNVLPAPSLVVRHDFRFDAYTRMMDAYSLLAQALGSL